MTLPEWAQTTLTFIKKGMGACLKYALHVTVFAAWEHWLARTKRFVSNSTVEFLANGAKWLVSKLKSKGKEDGKGH